MMVEQKELRSGLLLSFWSYHCASALRTFLRASRAYCPSHRVVEVLLATVCDLFVKAQVCDYRCFEAMGLVREEVRSCEDSR